MPDLYHRAAGAEATAVGIAVLLEVVTDRRTKAVHGVERRAVNCSIPNALRDAET